MPLRAPDEVAVGQAPGLAGAAPKAEEVVRLEEAQDLFCVFVGWLGEWVVLEDGGVERGRSRGGGIGRW